MRAVMIVCGAAMALAACQKTAPNASASAGAAATPAPATTSVTTIPHRKAGLWEQTIKRDGRDLGMGAMRMCLDAASEDRASVFSHASVERGLRDSKCSATNVNRGLDGTYSFSTTCPMGQGGTIATKGTASGDFSSSYHVHTESDISGAPYAQMNGHHATDVEGKWLGPCPADMKPGEMALGNGMKFNPGQFKGAAAAAAAAARANR